MLAVVGIAAGGALALPSIARADGETWRDGWCRQGEGQTVVIDWRATTAEDADQQLIRCVKLAAGATTYPLEGAAPPLTNPLESADIPYEIAFNGVFTSINDQTVSEGFTWHWATGTPTAGDAEGGNWEGKPKWEPVAGVDTVVGITLTDATDDASRLPATSPQFDPSEAPPLEPSPTPTESESPTTSPSTTPSDSASNSGTATPTVSASTSAIKTSAAPQTTSAPATTATSAAPTQQPSRTRRPTSPPRRTTRPRRPTNPPQQPVNPPPFIPPAPPIQNYPELPPIEDPLAPPPEDGTGQATDAPNATPSRVWGREDATRQGSEAIRSDTPAPWSQLAAVAGAVVIVGGLGTAFARGLQTSTPPVVEEE